jgi:excisionase family DNA binding protein
MNDAHLSAHSRAMAITPRPPSPVARAAEARVFGLDGSPVVIVTGREAVKLLTRTGLAEYRPRHRGEDPELDTALIALTVAANAYRNRLTDNGHQVAPSTVTQASCALTTARAADRLQCSQRTIVRAIHKRQLPAYRVGRQWVINSEDLDRYANYHMRQKGSTP